jgi:conflict system STAND superfamily ATPase
VQPEETRPTVLNDLDPKTAAFTIAAALALFITWKTLAFTKRLVGQILDAAFYILGRVFSRRLLTRTSLRQYCRSGLERSASKYLQVPGRRPRSLETDKIFVSLTLEDPAAAVEVNDLASVIGNRICVVGDPGSGKSSVVKNYFRHACRKALKLRQGTYEKQLPVLVELKNWRPNGTAGLPDSELAQEALTVVKSAVTRVHGFEMAALFDSYISDRGIVLLLDGLDEVASTAYPAVARAIRALSELLEDWSPRNTIVLTMRTQFHQQVRMDFDDQFPVTCYLRPLTQAGIREFLERWPFEATKARWSEIHRIAEELADRPTLREMCTNPLILAMYIANDQTADSGDVPETRTEFYSLVVEELIVARRARQLGHSDKRVLRAQREAILGGIAYNNISNPSEPANVASWPQAVEIVERVLSCTTAYAENALRILAKETGIFGEERPGETLRFMHLTFCEFLAAREAVDGRRDGWLELVGLQRSIAASGTRQEKSRLLEVIPFAIGLLPRSRRREAIDDVVKMKDHAMIGRCFLESQMYDHPAWDDYVGRASDSLLARTPDAWSEEWFQALHLLTVVLRDEQRWRLAYSLPASLTLDELFRKLIRSDDARLTKLFTSYASIDPAASLRLTEAIGMNLIVDQPLLLARNLESAPFCEVALKSFQGTSEHEASWASIFTYAAVSNPGVAARLSGRPAGLLASFVADAPQSCSWSKTVPTVESKSDISMPDRRFDSVSVLTVCLTLVRWKDLRPPAKALATSFDAIKRANPPGSLVSRDRLRAIALLMHFSAAAATILRITLLPILPLQAIGAVFVAAATVQSYLVARSGVYRALIYGLDADTKMERFILIVGGLPGLLLIRVTLPNAWRAVALMDSIRTTVSRPDLKRTFEGQPGQG